MLRLLLVSSALLFASSVSAGTVLVTATDPDRASYLNLNYCCSSQVALMSPLDSASLTETRTEGNDSGTARADGVAEEGRLRLDMTIDGFDQVSAQAFFLFQVDRRYRGLIRGGMQFDGGAAPFLQINSVFGNDDGIVHHYAADNRNDAMPADGLKLGDASPFATVFTSIGSPVVELLPDVTYTFSASLIADRLGEAANGISRHADGYLELVLYEVPEPMSSVLACLALLALAASRKRSLPSPNTPCS